jgi:putative endonuclease
MPGRGRKKAKTRQELARIGEEHAARYLRSLGYRVRERNYRTRSGEIDIVAEHKGALVFVEVKARSATDFAEPRESVTPTKQRQVARVAASYLGARERRERVTRFDVVEVFVTPEGRVEKLNVIAGAFEAR